MVACTITLAAAVAAATAMADCPAALVEVPRFGIYETELVQQSDVENPYWDLEAKAFLTGPEETTVAVDLFWDGGKSWRFRFSPPTVGLWRWRTVSPDSGLDGRRGQFQCVASERRGGIRARQDFPFHFEYEDGTPYWLFGDTHWSLFGSDPEKNYTRRTFENYVRRRAEQKFNFAEGILTSPPAGNEGGPIFTDDRQRRLSVPFFREVDERVDFLNGHGLTVMMFLSWSGIQHEYCHPAWNDFADAEARLKYARYVASRYGAMNVCFGVVGEWEGNRNLLPEFEAMARLLYRHPNRRMVCIHPSPGTTRQFNDREWMSFGDYAQTYTNLHSMILKSRLHDPGSRTSWPPERRKPVVNGEYALFMRDQNGDGKVDKPNSDSVDTIRHATWDIVMGGGYFVTGFGSTYWGGYRNPRAGFAPGAAIDAPWEQQVQHIYDLFTTLQWWKLEPSDHRVEAVGPHSEKTTWCHAEPGVRYLVYVRNAERVSVQLDDAEATYRLERFNPRTGKRTDLGIVPGGPCSIATPDRRDTVFLVQLKTLEPSK